MPRNGTTEVLKRARQQAIADVVRTRHPRTQRELVAALKDKGFGVAQATVSRDITEMGLVKIRVDGTQVYALPSSEAVVEQSGEQRLRELLCDRPIDVRESSLMLVIRAVPGTAHADVWPAVLAMIRECNIRNFSIFHYDGRLFSYFEYIGDDYEADMARMAADPETQRWWAWMNPMQQPLEDRAEGEWWHDLDEVFHTD